MDTRRSSRLRMAVNDSAKQRLSRFIRRNLQIIENNIFTNRPTLVKSTRKNPKNKPRPESVGEKYLDETAEVPHSSTVNLMDPEERMARPASRANSIISSNMAAAVSVKEKTLEEAVEVPHSSTVNLMDPEERMARPASRANSIISLNMATAVSVKEKNLEEAVKEPESPTGNLMGPEELMAEPVSPVNSIISTPGSNSSPVNIGSPESFASESEDDTRKSDLGLDTLKQTMVELFTTDSVSTLPFINRKWPEKSSGNSLKKKLPDPKRKHHNESSGFLSLLDLKANRYFVQCQLDDVEREIINYVARRWNWTRDLQLSHDTKYVIVKNESINEVVDGIPENAMTANASGGCVFLFNFVRECAANDELIHVREDHLPFHHGIRRKMLGKFSTTLMFEDFAFFITPEISSSGRHERDYALLRNLLQLTCSKLCSSLEELRSSTATYKVALRSTAISDLDEVTFVHYHWLYESILNYKLYSLKPYACDFTSS